jgi:hypothetical protein
MRSLMLTMTFALALGCSSSNNHGGPGGSAGQSAGGTTASGGSGGGVNPTSCSSLCSHTNTASTSEQSCVEQQAYLMGYDWPSDPVCSTIATSGDCQLCTSNLAMAQADCATLESSCFGSGSGGSGSGGSGSGGSGSGGSGGIGGFGGSGAGGSGGGGGGVSTCAELCTHAPTSTPAEQQCVETQSYLMGYDWSAQPICAAAGTTVGCNACTGALAMKDADCASVYAQCF